jgi:DNA-directed RNA polymerase specialized sigma24 family protein
VAHCLGDAYAHRFALLYPLEVAGLVWLDAFRRDWDDFVPAGPSLAAGEQMAPDLEQLRQALPFMRGMCAELLMDYPEHVREPLIDADVPESPTGWLVTTGWRKALDRLRRDSVGREKVAQVAAEPPPEPGVDDRLAMVFACCHPDLAEPARVALTLYAASGLSTAEIAAAFLNARQLRTWVHRSPAVAYGRHPRVSAAPVAGGGRAGRAIAASEAAGPTG